MNDAMKDKLDITLRIADSKLALTIVPEEEPLLRAVAKEVNHAYEAYRRRFTDNTPQEILAKVTLLFAKGYLNLAEQARQTDELLGRFEADLDKILIGESAES